MTIELEEENKFMVIMGTINVVIMEELPPFYYYAMDENKFYSNQQ